ncbi:ABC transporter ATP-binding protein [Myxosarcina sp. GI1]|uniref:ABC transporter ATP-binding protein n=1 Tax=Myxosarcina sp. GI1 TaxID=1541065 RepID=UPI000560B963|nr:ATP-binding cassette domain-containing protein [Myxosarcina sp. GI1]
MSQFAIEAIDLTKKYRGVTAVDRISFSIKSGETFGLIGTSGCGKTTTLKMLNRLIEPTGGRILINGKDVCKSKSEKLRQDIGYVIQNTGLFPHYTVGENVAVVPRLKKWKEKRIGDRTNKLLAMVGLPPQQFAHRYPRELSGGQQQRVGLARALAADPPIVLLDEPFGALDRITRSQIQQEFKHLESLLQKTMVLVTHDVMEAVTLCDRLCLMDRGKVEQIGTPRQLLFQPQNDFVRDFFDTNRFQLELSVTHLGELLPWLQPLASETVAPKQYRQNQSLLNILEDVEASSLKSSLVGISDRHDRQMLVTNCQELLNAFYQYKKS